MNSDLPQTPFTPLKTSEETLLNRHPILQIPLNDHGGYTILGRANGHLYDFLIDSGANWVVFSKTHADKLGLDPEQMETIRIETGAGISPSKVFLLPKLEIGPWRFTEVPALLMDLDSTYTALIGTPILRLFRIVMEDDIMTISCKIPIKDDPEIRQIMSTKEPSPS